jgi:hypothetical protein
MPKSANNYSNLSLKDLIEARDMFHVHLMNKKNVVATALGRYLIRTTDIDQYGVYKPQKKKPPRTLDNSIVMDISWPCILVFVDEWAEREKLINKHTSDIVPTAIYMPDSRVVPICVVQAPKSHVSDSNIDLDLLRFPVNLVGGGFPLFVYSQGRRRVATVGCLVSDGHKFFALTNKHVTGQKDEKIYTILGGREIRIGRSSKSLGKLEFERLYKGWKGNNLLVSCDAGLVDIEDVNLWKTEVLGVGQMDGIYDLNTINLSLDLVAEHKMAGGRRQPSLTGNVVGYGAYSQKLDGEISGLFYRYKSIGGAEYLSDFLISGRNGENLNIHHGDSGLVWHLVSQLNCDSDKKDREDANQKVYNPIALHWGQHEFFVGNDRNKFSYSLSTSLSNICRELDVDLVRGWNIDADYSWGKTGHYKIAALACDIVINKNLKKLLQANKENISFTDDGMLAGKMKEAKWGQFCALADVPDIVWRMTRKADEANHFADMDEKNPSVMNGQSLLDLCKSPDNIDIDVWNEYYEGMEAQDSEKSSDKRGALPFRVWHAFNLMVDYLKAAKSEKKAENLAKFICIGGTVSHYLGDACQPLHISFLHHGHQGKEAEAKVHSVYETDMLDRAKNMTELFDKLKIKFKQKQSYETYGTGKKAAEAVVELMRHVYDDILSPEEVIDVFNETQGGKGRVENMWNKLGDRTVECIAEGSSNLALFWESAWAAGDGDENFKDADLVTIDEQKLIDLYMDKSFFPPYKLKDPAYKAALGGAVPSAGDEENEASTPKKKRKTSSAKKTSKKPLRRK